MGPIFAGIGLLLFVLACFASGRAMVRRRPQSVTSSLAIVNKSTMAKEEATTPTRQRRLTRPNTITRATMQRHLRTQRRAHAAALAKRDADWSMLLALMVMANQPRPVEERRPVAAAPRVVAEAG